ncbi:hypothetical protein JCM10207_006947 [Rhodosporidiobolus poonsookiae]
MSSLAPPAVFLAAAALFLVALKARFGFLQQLWGKPAPAKASPLPVKAAEEPLRLPDPEPWLDFDLETAEVRDHLIVNKTVRYPYFQTMAHQNMHPNHWIEVDRHYRRDLEYKRQVIEEHPDRTVLSLPENDAACGELLELLVDYLPKRYPTLFEALPDGGIYNKVTDERFPDAGKLDGVPALKVASRLVQDDFLMAHPREDGHFYMTGGLVAIPGFYDLREKVNKSMFNIHVPVPQFNEKLLMSVERTLHRLKPHQPIERSSWEIVDDMKSHHHNIADLDPDNGDKVSADLHPKDLIFRIDHQTFRKLPRSGAVIFAVRPVLRPLHTFADLPLIPALLATVHEKAPADLMKYKMAPCYQDRMLPYLKELTQSQIDRGLIKGDEDVSTFRDLVAKA